MLPAFGLRKHQYDMPHLMIRTISNLHIVGAPLSGYLSDRAVIRAIKKHGPTNWLPEERLKGSILGAILPVPLSVLFSGLITKYIGGPLGLVLNLLCFFMNGIGVDMCLAPLSAYTVDILHDRSAEVLAAGMYVFSSSQLLQGLTELCS